MLLNTVLDVHKDNLGVHILMPVIRIKNSQKLMNKYQGYHAYQEKTYRKISINQFVRVRYIRLLVIYNVGICI